MNRVERHGGESEAAHKADRLRNMETEPMTIPEPRHDPRLATGPKTEDPVPGGIRQSIIQFLRCPRCTRTAGYPYPASEGTPFKCNHCHRPFTLEAANS